MADEIYHYRFRCLRGQRLKTFLAIAEEVVPPDDAGPGGGTIAAAALADWAISRLDPNLQKLFLIFLTAWEFMGFLFGVKPFTWLSSKARRRQMHWFETAPIPQFRTGFFGLRAMALMGVYCREDSWPAIGYDGPLLFDRAFPDPEARSLQKGRVEAAP
jgi:hypothetical protein